MFQAWLGVTGIDSILMLLMWHFNTCRDCGLCLFLLFVLMVVCFFFYFLQTRLGVRGIVYANAPDMANI